ncbi:hypothetical protein [Microbacterium sp. No. 7]|uniref:hypothetical protein n=1 Tax=Microbacterium sp. No. 7 TaxID=1714373 RepID=UPI0006D0E331|nr:hypothetical protein [Microbacterium sp. No. 7]ALJ18701.1 hypothetical protein AOA12_01750 [Microbacterium sp. No. 7]
MTMHDETEKTPPTPGMRRRTVIRGAAWSMPVIAAAVSLPAAAATTSAPLTVVFSSPDYSASGCASVGPVIVLVHRGDAAASAVPVTVSLPDGLIWSDGTTAPREFTSDSAGQIVLTDLATPANSGIYALHAVAENATATAAVTVTGSSSAPTVWQNFRRTSLDRDTTYANIPAAATPLGNNYFLLDGTLYWGNDQHVGGVVVATGVTDTIAFHGNDMDFASVLVGGVWTSYRGKDVDATYGAVPASAQKLENNYFLDDTTLYFKNTVVSTNVVAARGWHGGNADYADVLIDSTWASYAGTGVYEVYPAVPASAAPIGNKYFLDGTTLWFKNSIVTTNANAAVGFRSPDQDYADVLLGSTWVTYREGDVFETFGSVPATARALGNHYFLDGRTLFYKNTVISANAGSAIGFYGGRDGTHDDFVNFVDPGTC